jgi:hypothetical protein
MVVVYVLAKSKTAHSSRQCPHIRSKRTGISACALSPKMRRCQKCFADGACMICTETKKDLRPTPCGFHSICRECLAKHIDLLLQEPNWDGKVQCPCGTGGALASLPQEQQKKIISTLATRSVANIQRSGHLDFIVDDVLTLRCPHCRTAFCDFTGCAAVKCRCRKYFCGFCLTACEDDQACHAHVRRCRLNPNPDDYFIRFDAWLRVQHNRKCAAVWSSLHDVLWETNSLTYTVGVLLLLRRLDHNCILPYALSACHIEYIIAGLLLCLSSSLCLHACAFMLLRQIFFCPFFKAAGV